MVLVEIHTGPEFDVARDMLTRTFKTGDIAPDVSVFPRVRDPRTGGQQIEQLAFEIVSTESLGHAGRKAAKLVARGVRCVFAIDVERVRPQVVGLVRDLGHAQPQRLHRGSRVCRPAPHRGAGSCGRTR